MQGCGGPAPRPRATHPQPRAPFPLGIHVVCPGDHGHLSVRGVRGPQDTEGDRDGSSGALPLLGDEPVSPQETVPPSLAPAPPGSSHQSLRAARPLAVSVGTATAGAGAGRRAQAGRVGRAQHLGQTPRPAEARWPRTPSSTPLCRAHRPACWSNRGNRTQGQRRGREPVSTIPAALGLGGRQGREARPARARGAIIGTAASQPPRRRTPQRPRPRGPRLGARRHPAPPTPHIQPLRKLCPPVQHRKQGGRDPRKERACTEAEAGPPAEAGTGVWRLLPPPAQNALQTGGSRQAPLSPGAWGLGQAGQKRPHDWRPVGPLVLGLWEAPEDRTSQCVTSHPGGTKPTRRGLWELWLGPRRAPHPFPQHDSLSGLRSDHSCGFHRC